LESNRGTTSELERRPRMSDNSPKPRVLVVDDDESICLLLNEKLLSDGFQSHFCTSGQAAIQLLSQNQFDAVISDLNMPGVNGFDLLEATRRHLPHAAFLMATGVNDISTGVAAMKQGAADYLLKPFRLDAVIASLERALGIKQLETELENYRKHLEEMVEQRTKQLKAALRRIELTYDETLEALATALDLRDNDTAGHSRRVTLYSLAIAKAMGCSDELCRHLTWGASLHDIGKMGIPDSILLKTSGLTPEEKTIMQTHVRIGFKLMGRIAFLAPAAEIVLGHHERFDGTGYPQGLTGEEIPLGARIFAVADTLDAITSDRPYRRARPFGAARKEIETESGKQFDPRVVGAFLSIEEGTWERIRLDAAMTRPNVQRAFSPALNIEEKSKSHSLG
jgi:putative nucleotidyltransferase with HDIG domain